MSRMLSEIFCIVLNFQVVYRVTGNNNMLYEGTKYRDRASRHEVLP